MKRRNRINRRKPWVIALCVIIALIMVLPMYDVFRIIGEMRDSADSPANIDPQAYIDEMKEQAEDLENYIEEYGPTLPVLKKLAQDYRTMAYFLTDGEEDYLEKAALAMEKAIDLEPSDMESYILLYSIYNEMGKVEDADEKAKTLEALVLEQLQEDPDDNVSRYYYSIILEKYHRDLIAAKEQLDIILNTEPEDSELFAYAKNEVARIDELMEHENAEENGD